MNCARPAFTTRSDTRTVTIEVPATAVFDFVADPRNLPLWAVGFCRSIRRGEGEHWLVATASGDVAMRYQVDEAAGTIDFHFSPAPDVDAAAFSRVVPNGACAEYIFTQFQSPGMPNDVFDAQVRALAEELQVLRSLLQARHACGTANGGASEEPHEP